MKRVKKHLLPAILCAFCVAAMLPADVLAASSDLPKITPGPDSSIKVEGEMDTRVATGAIGTKQGITVAEYRVLLDYDVPEGYTLVFKGNNYDWDTNSYDDLDENDIVYTMCTLDLISNEGSYADLITIIIAGDVLGAGRIDIAQLSRMAKALNGSEPLDYSYRLAADFNGDDTVDISDLVAEAKIIAGA